MRKRSAFAGALAACVVAASVLPAAALAAGPYRISDVEDDAVAIQDLGTKVEVSAGVVQVWETQLYNQTQAAPAAYDERRTLREFDCAHRAVRTRDVVSYRGGQVVAAQAAGGWSAWKTIAPQAPGELSLLTACCPHPEATETYGSMAELKRMAWGRVSGPQS
ncbi:MAG TPA: surface-adhesin E family protein [Phenylobacterium sp.]|uniref:surface-adhesin E family protein n=1 Tax=Phenylobacterium sp. TaxID=1871053 RepID=UPI002B4615EE|nr:surface-adhesin E family protein [Phenylobacterium sp.]HKR89999.1 surface-adhesin E family protein [Phenylobacterium sp.]